ncbi:MAG: GH25 family lysozyme [Muricomes sp.]
MSFQGLSVSELQGIVDWERVKTAGYQFAMLCAGHGFGILDKRFQQNAAECNRIGLPIGAYWLCHATTPKAARQEADDCINIISSYHLDYPVCYNIEQTTIHCAAQRGITITPELASQFVQNFCSRAEDLGYYAMFYCDPNFLSTYFPPYLSRRYALWYSYYCDPLPSDPTMQNYITYVIQPGDTLSGIAHRYNTTYKELAALNAIPNPDIIYTGETIKVPENESI